VITLSGASRAPLSRSSIGLRQQQSLCRSAAKNTKLQTLVHSDCIAAIPSLYSSLIRNTGLPFISSKIIARFGFAFSPANLQGTRPYYSFTIFPPSLIDLSAAARTETTSAPSVMDERAGCFVFIQRINAFSSRSSATVFSYCG